MLDININNYFFYSISKKREIVFLDEEIIDAF